MSLKGSVALWVMQQSSGLGNTVGLDSFFLILFFKEIYQTFSPGGQTWPLILAV